MPPKNKRRKIRKSKSAHKRKKRFKLERVISYNTVYAQMEKISPLVAKTLKEDFKTRDDDNALDFAIWKRQGSKDNWSVKKLKYKVIMGKFASSSTIERTRRKLQEHNPSLRGKTYKQRHETEKEVRNQMKIPFNF